MAAFDHISNMYDVAFKPRLLLTLVRDHLPDENQPFSDPSQVSKVVSLVKTHCLLSESFTNSTDPKQVEAWKSAVMTWVDRVLTLLTSTTMPDKCYAGVSLLGFTCQECSSDRFQESYPVWFQKLLPFLQSPDDSSLVRVAACVSISDLLARLRGFPNFKIDGSVCAVKVIHPVLKLLGDCNSEAIWEGAIHVLCTIITSFPSSINRHYDSVESAIASKLLFGGSCSLDMSKKLARCLALLPKSRADEESWSVMLQKILVVINDQLNFAFEGLEEETMRNEVIRLLILPPSPLEGYTLAEETSNRATKRSKQSLMSNVSTLMFGCCLMLTNSYPIKVNIPVCLLLALVERILMVNGSLPQMSLPFMTAKQQEDICSELPLLHLYSLELLTAIIKATGSRLLPHAGLVARIIAKYFKTCAPPELRIKVYSVTRTLLLSMGVGMALCLAQEVINNVFADLGTIESKYGGTSNGLKSNASIGPLLQPSNRKRKHGSTTSSLQEHDGGGDGLGVEVAKNHSLTPISLRIAVLEALEALITVAGSLRSEPWRSKVDNLLIVIAMDSFKSVSEEISVFQQTELAATATDLQLAALHALLASFLSFAWVRPPYLSQGLDLFRRGKEQTGTKLAEFCVHALLTLEVLIHRRGLPLANNNSSDEAQCNFQDENIGHSNRTPSGMLQTGHNTPDTDDDFIVSLLENVEHTQEPCEAFRDNNPKVLSTHLSSGTKIQERSEILAEVATSADVEMRVVDDEIISKSDQPAEYAIQCQGPVSYTTSIPMAEARKPAATEIASQRIVSHSNMPRSEGSSHM